MTGTEPSPPDDLLTLAGDDALPAPARAAVPAELAGGRYRLVRPLGAGASKQVFLAEDVLLHREVALAVIGDSWLHGPLHSRLLREVRTTARLDDHPHVVTIHDVRDEGGLTFVVTQLVRGGSVADRLRERAPGGLPVPEAVRIAREVASALEHAHGHGVVHRDVKPSNVLLASDGSALLADFGVALLADVARVTREGSVVGSPTYMAPEQAQGLPVDERGDLYALGATLFEMLCGRPPFVGDPLAVLAQHVHEPPPDPRALQPAVPVLLGDLVLRLLSKRPEERPASAREVAEALDDVLVAAQAPEPVAALPPALQTGEERRFVDRLDAVEALHRAWERAAAGRPSFGVAWGEPGIGKTRLAGAFAHGVRDTPATVLYGRCDEEPLVSYQPFVEALRRLLVLQPGLERRVDPRLERELAELGRLVPELRRRGGAPLAAEGEPQRHLLFEAVVALLAAAAAQRPLLLVLDDLQWADRPTLLLLTQLLRARDVGRIMVLGTTRDDPREPDHPLHDVLAPLRREDEPSRLELVALSGLGEGDTLELVGDREERLADPESIRLLHGETAGNPFFIEEVLRGLRDADLGGGTEAALRALGVPEGANDVILRRLARLSPATVELLRCAAVHGREFRLDVVAEVVGTSAAQAVLRLEEALGAGLVVERGVDRFAFCHALVRDALLGRLPSATGRLRLHLAVGEALERLGDAPLGELAHHFHEAAAVGGAEKALRYGVAAARRAADALAYEEAAGHLEKALEALDALGPGREAEAFDLLHLLGRQQLHAGDREAARRTSLRAAERARRLGDRAQLARAALDHAARFYDAEAVDPGLVALLEEALAGLGEDETPDRARLLSALAEAVQFGEDLDAPLRLSADALAMARRTGDRDALIGALGARHDALLHVEHLPERLTLGREWLELARSEGHRNERAAALTWCIYDLVELGDLAQARALHAELAELAEELRQPQFLTFAATWEVNWLAMSGAFVEAAEAAKRCFGHARRAQGTFAASLYAGQLFGLSRDTGRLAELAGVVEPLVGDEPRLSAWRAGFVAIRTARGETERARADLAALARPDAPAMRRDGFWLPALWLLAEACAELGDRASAAALAEQLAPHAERNAQIGLAVFLGPVHRVLGLLAGELGDAAGAVRHFEAALERAAAAGAVTARARTECDYGAWLLERGEPRGLELLTSARATAARLGMAALERRAARSAERAA